MSTPGGLFRPYQKLVKIQLLNRECEVPENNMVLRALQYLATEGIAYGRFCWNEECQYCRIVYDTGEGTPRHTALACKMMIKEGIRIHEISTELKYCLRDLKLEPCGPTQLVREMTNDEFRNDD
jgi:predicted molibdopterin-dependent oxidoreductase YjgC